jgi:spectinomycin phosphotransferase
MVGAFVLPESRIVDGLEAAYGLSVAKIERLDLGADFDTVVYRVAGSDARHYFLKIRRQSFLEASVAVPHWLMETGMRQVVAPLATLGGTSWARLDGCAAILYPFVTGDAGWEIELSPSQWGELGAGLRALHEAALPPALMETVPRETFAPVWRDPVRAFMGRVADHAGSDAVAARLAGLLWRERAVIHRLVARAEQLAGRLVQRRPDHCLCHGDIHAGNVFIECGGRLYLVDWDTLVLAPKERDLMFIGGGVGGVWNRGRESAWFYRGYGAADVDPVAMTYYRHERIVQDVGEICAQVCGADGGDDCADMVEQLAAQFAPGNVVDIAFATDRALLAGR